MKSKSTAIWVLMCGAALGVGAIAEYVAQAPSLRPRARADTFRTEEPPVQRSESPTSKPGAPLGHVLVFVPSMDANGISFVEQAATVPAGADQRLTAVNEFLKAAQIASDGAAALSVNVADDGTATIAFNKKFDQTYGAFDEKKMIDGLRAALGQFKEVTQFTMVIDGKPVTTLGSADLSSPIPVIRPGDVPMPQSGQPASGESTKP